MDESQLDPYGEDAALVAIVRSDEAVAAAARPGESEERLRQLIENVDAVSTLWQAEPPGYVYVSPQFEQLTGYPSGHLLADENFTLNTLVHPDDREQVLGRLQALLASGGPGAMEHRIIRADGAVRWVRSTVKPVRGAEGRLTGRVVGTSTDVTERVTARLALARAEAEARSANDAKNEFLSRMSHELRTPLHAILGFGQLLEMELEGTESLSSVEHVLNAGRHLLALIDEVLDLARIEARQMSVTIEPVAVYDVTAEVRSLVAPQATSAGIVLDPLDSDATEQVLADRGRLRQVLLNLLTNAIKYNRPGGRVATSWTAGDGRCRISVRDDGPGIPTELQARLFTPFDRLGAEATSIEGTGVGLSVTQALVDLMGGQISVDSAPGRGSVFTVDLPLAADTATPAPRLPVHDADPGAEEGDGRRSRPDRLVLCIDDDEASAHVLESIVALRPRWRFVRAGDGRLGILLARGRRPDLVFLDLSRPELPDLDVLVSLHRATATSDVPVAVLSADASPTQVQRLTSAGAWRYLTKPAVIPHVLALLDEVATTTGSEQLDG